MGQMRAPQRLHSVCSRGAIGAPVQGGKSFDMSNVVDELVKKARVD